MGLDTTPKIKDQIDSLVPKVKTPAEAQQVFRDIVPVPVATISADGTQVIEEKGVIARAQEWAGSTATKFDRWMAAKYVYGPAEKANVEKINTARQQMDALRAYAQQPGLDPLAKADVLQRQLALKTQIDSYAAARVRAADGLVQYYEPKLRDRLVERQGIDGRIATAQSERDAADRSLEQAVAELNDLEPEIQALLTGGPTMSLEKKKELETALARLKGAITTAKDTIATKDNVLKVEREKQADWQRRHGRGAEKLDRARKITAEGGTVDTLAEQMKQVLAVETKQEAPPMVENVISLGVVRQKRARAEAPQAVAPQKEASTTLREAGEFDEQSWAEATRIIKEAINPIPQMLAKELEQFPDSVKNGKLSVSVLLKLWNTLCGAERPKLAEVSKSEGSKIEEELRSKSNVTLEQFASALYLQSSDRSDTGVVQGVLRIARAWSGERPRQVKKAA